MRSSIEPLNGWGKISGADHLDSFVDVEMLTHFYVVALAGMVESWLLGEIDRTPEQLIQFSDVILNDQVNGAAIRHNIKPE